MKIFTHFFLSLDAVASVWAAKEFIPGAADALVKFVPVDWTGDKMEQDDLALDIHAGGRGLKSEMDDATGIVHSCFSTIVSAHATEFDQQALAPLVAFVNVRNMLGNATRILAPELSVENLEIFSATSLNAVLQAFQVIFPHEEGLVIERMSEIFSGSLVKARTKVRAQRAEKGCLFTSRIRLVG